MHLDDIVHSLLVVFCGLTSAGVFYLFWLFPNIISNIMTGIGIISLAYGCYRIMYIGFLGQQRGRLIPQLKEELTNWPKNIESDAELNLNVRFHLLMQAWLAQLGGKPIPGNDEQNEANRQETHAKELGAIPEISRLGPLFKSSIPVKLTNSVTEYNVVLIKHVFNNHIVLQFDCQNTLEKNLIQGLFIKVRLSEASGLKIIKTLPSDALLRSQLGSIYVILEGIRTFASFTAILYCEIVCVDPVTGEPNLNMVYKESSDLMNFEITIADFLKGLKKTNFDAIWKELTEENEVEFHMDDATTFDEALKKVLKDLPLSQCERSERPLNGTISHEVFMAGIFYNGNTVLAKVKFAINPANNRVSINGLLRSNDVFDSAAIHLSL